MKRYFSGGPWAGTWRELPIELSVGGVWRVSLPRWAGDLMLAEQDASVLTDESGDYRLVKLGQQPAHMQWAGERRHHWTTHLPPGDQLDAEVTKLLHRALLPLYALAAAAVEVERECEWWFPPGFLKHSTVIHGIHVEYRDVTHPILVCHAIPSGWRAGV